jgi:hypothetical protein
MNGATALTLFRRKAEKSLGFLRVKLQKLTLCRNAINDATAITIFFRRKAEKSLGFL